MLIQDSKMHLSCLFFVINSAEVQIIKKNNGQMRTSVEKWNCKNTVMKNIFDAKTP